MMPHLDIYYALGEKASSSAAAADFLIVVSYVDWFFIQILK